MQIKPEKIIKRSLVKFNDFVSKHSLWVLFLKVALVFGLFFIICDSNLDPDFGWHLAAGNYFRAHGIPTHDVFTYTARSFRWIDHEWGNDVITSIIYQHAGYIWLAGLFASIWTASLFLVSRKIRLIYLLLGVAAMVPYVVIRPTAWDALGLAAFVSIFSSKKLWLLWLLPVLTLIWANLHGGFVLGIGVILVYALLRKSWHIFGFFIVCILISFINPYGPTLYVEIFRTLTDVSLHFETNGMSVFTVLYSAWPLTIMWGVGFWIVAKKQLKNWIEIEPLMLIAALAATRNFPLFAVVATPKVDDYFRAIAAKIPPKINKVSKAMICGFIVLLFSVTIYQITSNIFPISSNREASYPIKAVSFLKHNMCPGNLFNDFDYGGYLIWKLPSAPVYIDGRMPSWRNNKGEKYYSIYSNVINSAPVMRSEFKKYDIKCVLVENNNNWHLFTSRLKTKGWTPRITANGAILLTAP